MVYIIKQDYPLKVDGIINIVQMIVIVDHSSLDSVIRMLTPGPLPTIIAARTLLYVQFCRSRVLAAVQRANRKSPALVLKVAKGVTNGELVTVVPGTGEPASARCGSGA